MNSYSAFEIYKDDYKIHVRECKNGDVIEIDTYDELCELDSSYLNDNVLY